MKIRKTSVGLLAIAGLLGGVVYVTGAPVQEVGKAQGDRLFGFQEADVQALQVNTLTKSLAFERVPAHGAAASATSNLTTIWRMTAPRVGPANDGAIAFLLNLLATGKSQQSLKVAVTRLAEFELDRPFAKIEVKLKDQKVHRMVLGKTLFNNTGIYAQIDPPEPPPPEVTVLLVPLDFQNAVIRPETEWQPAPPEIGTKETAPKAEPPKAESPKVPPQGEPSPP